MTFCPQRWESTLLLTIHRLPTATVGPSLIFHSLLQWQANYQCPLSLSPCVMTVLVLTSNGWSISLQTQVQATLNHWLRYILFHKISNVSVIFCEEITVKKKKREKRERVLICVYYENAFNVIRN